MKYIIKELSEEDLEKDLNGFLLSLQNLSSTGEISIEEAKGIFKKINLQGSKLYIAISEQEGIMGVLTLLIEQKFIHKGGKVGHIEDVSIRKGFQGQGIGGSLVRKSLDTAKNLGCYKVILDCGDKNLSFYKRLGFRVHENGMRFDI